MARSHPVVLFTLFSYCAAWPEWNCRATEVAVDGEGALHIARRVSATSAVDCASIAAGRYREGNAEWVLTVIGKGFQLALASGRSASNRTAFRGALLDNCFAAVQSDAGLGFTEGFQVSAAGLNWGGDDRWVKIGSGEAPAKHGEDDSDDSKVTKHAALSEEDDAVAVTVATMLFTMLLMGTGVMYLLNNSDQDIRENSIEMLSETMSVFCAVLLNQSIFAVIVEQIIEGQCPKLIGIKNNVLRGTVCIVLALVFWTLMTWLAWRARLKTTFPRCHRRNIHVQRDMTKELEEQIQEMHLLEGRKYRAMAVCHLGGHCVAFAGIQSATEFLYAGIHSDEGSLGLTCIVLAAVAVAMWSARCLYRAHRVRRIRPKQHDTMEKAFHIHFMTVIDHAEIQAIVLVLSFVFNQFFCFVRFSRLPELHGKQGKMDWRMPRDMWYGGLMFLVLNLCAHIVLSRVHVPKGWHSFIVNFFAMSMSWCMQWASLWSMMLAFTGVHQVTADLSNVINAFAVSLFSVLCIYTIDKLADRLRDDPEAGNAIQGFDVDAGELGQGLRGIMLAFGLLVALSWDKAFDAAIETVVEGIDEAGHRSLGNHPVIYKCMLCLVMVAIVCPAWYWYIVPQLSHHMHHEGVHDKGGHAQIEECELPCVKGIAAYESSDSEYTDSGTDEGHP